MNQGNVTAEVSEDGKSVICRSEDGRVRWTRNPPSYGEWQRLARNAVSVNMERGKFQCVGDEIHGVIIAVFTPGGSLDFNLIYDACTGDLISIKEAR